MIADSCSLVPGLNLEILWEDTIFILNKSYLFLLLSIPYALSKILVYSGFLTSLNDYLDVLASVSVWN